jgi:4TM region of DNA translocase FtsK/SpoIIIE
MPAMRYTFSAADIFSDELRAALRRRMHEIIGVALIGVSGIAAVALATWSVQDPSLSHATNAPVRNMLGLPGAVSADLMMQLLVRSIAKRCADCCGSPAHLRPLGLPRACRQARRGRCRPDLAA